MRRSFVPAVLTLAVLVPAPAWAQQSPSPEASPTPSPTTTHQDCAPSVATSGTTLPPTGASGLDGYQSEGPVISVDGGKGEAGQGVVAYGYVRPSTTFRELGRATTDESGYAEVRLGFVQGNVRVYFVSEGCPFPSPHYVLPVQARLGGLHAHRNGPRDYTFSTFYAGPSGKVGSLYRVLPDGREVLTAQTRLGGEWIILRRTFTGSGRFGFVLRSGNDINSLGASTNVRDTVIH